MTASYTLEYTYRRSVGPVLGRFLGALREARFEGQRAENGDVIVPPPGYDPSSGEPLTAWVEVGPAGTVTTWAFVGGDAPFAWALIRLDGASTALLHKVAAQRESDVHTGLRVRPRWAPERTGAITDVECFEPETST